MCAQLLTQAWFFVTLWTRACQAPLSIVFFRQEYWSSCHFLLQGSSRPSNDTLIYYPSFWQAGSLPLSHQVRELLVGHYLRPLTGLMYAWKEWYGYYVKKDHHRGRGEVMWEEGGLHVQVGRDGDSGLGHSRENSQKWSNYGYFEHIQSSRQLHVKENEKPKMMSQFWPKNGNDRITVKERKGTGLCRVRSGVQFQTTKWRSQETSLMSLDF